MRKGWEFADRHIRFRAWTAGILAILCMSGAGVARAAVHNITYGANRAAVAVTTPSTAQQYVGSGSWYKLYPAAKAEMYISPQNDLGATFTVAQIQSITYHGYNAANSPPVEYFLAVYTKGTAHGFYEQRLNAEPYLKKVAYAPALGSWSAWTTSGPDELTFTDHNNAGNAGFYNAPTLAEIQAAAGSGINWSTWPANPNQGTANATPIDYAAQEVLYISFQTGSGWAAFDSYLDGITIALTNGETYEIDLEAGPDPIYVDDDWTGLPNGTPVGDGRYIGLNAFATIQGGIGGASPTATVHVAPGNYPENVTLNKSLTLLGAQSGVGACGRVVGAPSSTTESIVSGPGPRLWNLVAGSAGSVIDGFSFSGGSRQIESTGGPLDDLVIENNHFTGFTGNAMFLNDSGRNVTLDANNVDAGSQTSGDGSIHLDTDSFLGFHLTNNCIGGTPNATAGSGLFVDGNHNVGVSIGAGGRTPLISGNILEKHTTNVGANLGSRSFTGGTISNNTVRNNAFDGIQGGIQNTTISGNRFENNGRNGLVLTSFGNLGVDRGGQNCTITGNYFLGNGFTNTGAGYAISSTQAPGNAATNHANLNDIVGNRVGASYAGGETIDVGCNWWGDLGGPDYPPANPNPPGDDLVASSATYQPWLNGSIAGSPSCTLYGTTTTLSSDINPSTCGQKVTLTATVASGTGTPTGSVEFFDGGASLGTEPLVGNTATHSVSTLPAGHRALTARYSGDVDHGPSISNTLIQNVHCAGTLTTAQATTCDPLGWTPANVTGGGTVAISATYPRDGSGSLEFNTIGSSSKADFFRLNGNADLLTTLSALQVELYRNSTSTSALFLAPAVRLYIDNGQPVNRFSTLIWEPAYNGYPVAFPTNAWEPVDLFKGNFWMRAFRTTGGKTIDLYQPLAVWLQPGFFVDGNNDTSNVVGPNARVIAYDTGVGSGWAGTFAGAVDHFRIGFNGADSVFNFDPNIVTTIALAAAPSPSPVCGKLTLTATVTPSDLTGMVEFADQSGTPAYFDGFETDLGGAPGWDNGDVARVPSGTNGIPSASGAFHAEAATNPAGSAFTRWGGYNSVFPPAGYSTLIDVYLDMTYAATAGDVRFDFTSAINNSGGTHLSDFAFNFGTEPTGFVVTAGNNTGRANANPADPGHDPAHLTQTGWYTLKYRFYNDGGVLACDLSIIDPNGSTIVGGPAWTRRNPAHQIALVGGNRYGWFANQELPVLAFDNARRVSSSLGSAPIVNGVATLSVTGLALGSHALIASFPGGGCILGSSSDKLAHEVVTPPSATTLTSSANPSVFGDKVTFTATVPGDATGSVEFFDGATSLGVSPVSSGSASVSAPSLSTGNHSITAVYSGDGCYLGSTSNKLEQVVNPIATVKTIESDNNPSACGEKVNLTATVVPSDATGTVEFFEASSGPKAGLFSEDPTPAFPYWSDLRPVTVGVRFTADVAGTVTSIRFYKDAQNSGAHLVELWRADGTLLASAPSSGETASGWQTVTLSTAVPILPNTEYIAAYHTESGYAQDVNFFTASHDRPPLHAPAETPARKNGVYEYGPAGTFPSLGVQASNYYVDLGFATATSLGAPVAVGGGTATLSVSDLPVGSHSIYAVYNGDTDHSASVSDLLVQVVDPAASSTALVSDNNPSVFGTKVNLTATVSPAGATGSVEFFDGVTSLGTVALSGQTANYSTTTLTNGSHSITAVYSGDGCYAGGTSNKVDQVVNDENAPLVHVITPDLPLTTLFIGTPYKISWEATDDKEVTSITLCVSRDNGTTWEEIVADIANSGTYMWNVTGPGTNNDATPVYSALIKVKAKDAAGNLGTDDSDNPFAIYDIATDALLSQFLAEPVAGGIEVRWQFGGGSLVSSVALERAEREAGPWTAVVGESREEAGVTVVVDRTAQGGRSYFYRLQARLPDGQSRTFGPVVGTAGAGVTAFEITSIRPNPALGFARIEYAVARDADVRLSVLDLQGREIAVLANGRMQPGRYLASWDGRTDRGAAPAGLYFVRFQTPGRNLVQRLILNR